MRKIDDPSMDGDNLGKGRWREDGGNGGKREWDE